MSASSELRAIDASGFRPAVVLDQPAPQLLWVALADLVIDDQYQRAITANGRALIQRIADGWDWRKFQPILVAPTLDGRLAVVDGQHRAHAAVVAGLERLPALCVAMTPVEQAAGFAAVNRDRIKLDSFAIYRAELAAGVDWAVRAKEAVEAGGCRLMTCLWSTGQKKPGMVFAIGLMRRMVAAGEDFAIQVGLRAIRDSAAGAEAAAYDGRILNLWLPALAQNQTYLRLPLAAIYDDIDWDDWIDAATLRARRIGKGARPLLIEQVVDRLQQARAAA